MEIWVWAVLVAAWLWGTLNSYAWVDCNLHLLDKEQQGKWEKGSTKVALFLILLFAWPIFQAYKAQARIK